jgi:hypothetical protein
LVSDALVLKGRYKDDQDDYQGHDRLHLSAGTTHRPASKAGYTLYIKEARLAARRSVRSVLD